MATVITTAAHWMIFICSFQSSNKVKAAPGPVPCCRFANGGRGLVLYRLRFTQGNVFTYYEQGLAATGYTLGSWLEAWVAGTRIWDTMFEFEAVTFRTRLLAILSLQSGVALPKGLTIDHVSPVRRIVSEAVGHLRFRRHTGQEAMPEWILDRSQPNAVSRF